MFEKYSFGINLIILRENKWRNVLTYQSKFRIKLSLKHLWKNLVNNHYSGIYFPTLQ